MAGRRSGTLKWRQPSGCWRVVCSLLYHRGRGRMSRKTRRWSICDKSSPTWRCRCVARSSTSRAAATALRGCTVDTLGGSGHALPLFARSRCRCWQLRCGRRGNVGDWKLAGLEQPGVDGPYRDRSSAATYEKAGNM
ncbi:hypothetical protein BD311DRAFT_180665 [Dichomitus squalens]|uniref:Uncharacterized protein n=1 Tax=Dichomitus squalens TaxID=114155 RepID=A0A4Q9M6W4_9APHY|nr:hypothetical protein BD311DRAFT_180665 [Dichomitus squalens]